MNPSTQRIDVDTFLASLCDRTAQGVSTIALDGGELPVAIFLQDPSSLVFTFTGAANRSEGKSLPQFASTRLDRYISASYICLGDPSLALNDEMRLAWYSGHDRFALQQILPGLFQQIIESLGATRVVFLGGSGGGFAALYYSWQIAGSIALVLIPQTNLDRYHWGHRHRYRTTCWPSLADKTPLDNAIITDLSTLYASERRNTVIYIQTASDFFHLTRQFAPFIAALPTDYRDSLIVRVNDWVERGHKPAPTNIWIPWLIAALTAPETTATSIDTTWNERNALPLPPLEQRSRDTKGSGDTQHAPGKTQIRPVDRDESIASELARTAVGDLFDMPGLEESLL